MALCAMREVLVPQNPLGGRGGVKKARFCCAYCGRGGQKKQNFAQFPIRPTSIRAVAGGRHDVFAIAVGHKEVNKLFKLVEAGD